MLKAEREKENLFSSSSLFSRACPDCMADVHIYICYSGTLADRRGISEGALGLVAEKIPETSQCPVLIVLKGCPRDCSSGRCCPWVGALQAESDKNLPQEQDMRLIWIQQVAKKPRTKPQQFLPRSSLG